VNLISPFGKLYGRIMELRNLFYDRDLLKSYDLGAPTISVGNLTTGGTGKTPLVALIARLLIDEGEAVCILTRGYGRKDPKTRVLVSDGTKVLVEAETGGDEPVELAHKLDGRAIIVAYPDRVAAAKWARDNFNLTTFILDDGFQHRRARRDLDIVCIDATNPCDNGRILPAGTLRESFKSLIRANAVVITRTEQVEQTTELEEKLRTRNPNALIFKARTQIVGLVPIDEFPGSSTGQAELPAGLAAFTGLGNPDNFFKSLDLANLNTVARESFTDHHRFTPSDIAQVESKAREAGAAALVTTAKDAVKLKGLKFTFPCYVALAETVVDDLDGFKRLIRP
jgi:tetraacyldisaccharide 4'-kinase